MQYRVLIADDEEIERRALRHILSGGHFPELEILEASNGQAALTAVGDGRLDAAFLDIKMPGIDGIEAARRLREERPALSIVFLSAHDSFEYARSALRLHVEDFLLKPASSEEVRDALRKALARSAQGGTGERGSRTEATRLESAVAYMAGELRAELAAGRVDGEGLSRHAEIVGGVARISAVVALRLGAGDSIERNHAALRSAAALAERRLGGDGRIALAGAGPERVLCAVAAENEEQSRLGRELQVLIEEARRELGIDLVAGAALSIPSQPAGPDTADRSAGGPSPRMLAQAATRALVLAGSARSVVLVPLSPAPAAADGAALRATRGCSGAAQRVLELMEARYADDLSLDGIAAEFGMSASHLSRLLGRHAGLGFADCLARLRVEKAKTFLASGRTSIKEAALMVGFRDPAYFARVFRRFCSMSPAEYRADRAGLREESAHG